MKRTLIAAFVAATMALVFGSSGAVAAPTSAPARRHVAQSRTVTRTGKPVATTASTGTCWRWTGDFSHNIGLLAYSFRETVEWCANSAGTKVVSTNYSNICSNTGGYYAYIGCNKSRGSFGFTSLHVVDTWHYKYCLLGNCDKRNPSVDALFYPDGRVIGTVFYD